MALFFNETNDKIKAYVDKLLNWVITVIILLCFLLLLVGSVFSIGVMLLLNKKTKLGITLAVLSFVGLFVIFYIFNTGGLIDSVNLPEF